MYTAVALYWKFGSLAHVFVDCSQVRFQELDDARINQYFQSSIRRGGGYVQVGRELIVESVEGSIENVMGLPIQRLALTMEELGLDFMN